VLIKRTTASANDLLFQYAWCFKHR
jgi:hypothetical protein